jgi:hypothetical protein
MEGNGATSTAQDRLFGAAMIIGPLLLFISTLTYSAGGGINSDRLGGVIQVYAMATWIMVLMGLTRLVAARWPRATAVLTAAGAIGVAGGVAYGIDSIHVAETGRSAEEMGIGALALYLPGLLFPLSQIGFGAMLARDRVAPRWSGLLLVIAAILFPVSRIGSIEPLAIAADSLFVIALVPLGWQLLAGGFVPDATAVAPPRDGYGLAQK